MKKKKFHFKYVKEFYHTPKKSVKTSINVGDIVLFHDMACIVSNIISPTIIEIDEHVGNLINTFMVSVDQIHKI